MCTNVATRTKQRTPMRATMHRKVAKRLPLYLGVPISCRPLALLRTVVPSMPTGHSLQGLDSPLLRARKSMNPPPPPRATDTCCLLTFTPKFRPAESTPHRLTLYSHMWIHPSINSSVKLHESNQSMQHSVQGVASIELEVAYRL